MCNNSRFLLAVAILFASATLAPAAEFRAGIAVVDITGPKNYRMSGYFNERLSTGMHDPLQAKAVVFRQGTSEAALVFCDLIGPYQDVTNRAREQAARKTGIPAAHILIHGTHTHTGPLFEGALRKHFHDLAIEKHGNDLYEEIDYRALLVRQIVEAIAQAHGSARSVDILAGIAEQRGLSFNRRFYLTDGSVRFNPGKLNPDIIRPAGPIDPDVGIILLKSPDGQQNRAALTVFPLHLDTVGGTEYSADFPFYLERNLRQSLGNEFTSVFGNGTCGDINHVDVTNTLPQRGLDEAARIGTTLAETVRHALPRLKSLRVPKLAVRSGIARVPIQQYPPAELAQAKLDIFKVGTSQLSFMDQVKATKMMELQMRPAELILLEVQVFRLSDDLAIVGLPGEVFVDLGLDIKRRSPFARTLVVELCNDTPAYIPTQKAFTEGSYETINSLIQPGGGEAMVDLAVTLLQEIKAVE